MKRVPAARPERVHDYFQRNCVVAHAGATPTCHPQVALYTLNDGSLGSGRITIINGIRPFPPAGMIRVPHSRHASPADLLSPKAHRLTPERPAVLRNGSESCHDTVAKKRAWQPSLAH